MQFIATFLRVLTHRKLVRCHLRVHPGQVAQQRRLPHRGEPYEPDSGVSSLGDLEPFLRPPALGLGCDELPENGVFLL
jgi:hypothetical protein